MAKPNPKPPKGVYINGKLVTPEMWANGELLAAMTGGQPTAPARDHAPAAPVDTGPAEPVRVDPFFTSDDLNAINSFTTDLKLKLEEIDNNLGGLETDTRFEKTKVAKGAQEASVSATDDAISRGIFKSSLKDATLYDIEAQRSLSAKFLDDKLTAARLNAGTNKKILGDAKEQFDKNMLQRKVENATGVNDVNSSAFATAKSVWASNQPKAATPVAGSAAVPTFKPAAKPKDAFASAQHTAQQRSQSAVAVAQAQTKTKKPAKPRPIYG